MTTKFTIYLTLIMTLVLLSCSNKESGKLDLVAGYWGQVHQLEQLAPNSMYLLFVKPQDTYKVCVASHLVEDHPLILTEIDASIQIWGRYINRSIQTDIYQAEIEAPSATEHQDTTFINYINKCPEADIVLGYANINSVGLTANKYSHRGSNSDGLQVPENSQRVLFLQNPVFKNATWKSYLKEVDPSLDTNQLIAKLLDRTDYQLLEEANQYSTLTILMHEFGHVWGLCDMYPLAGGHTNCHPIWSKKDTAGNLILVPDAKMAAAGWKNPLFLHDDDIEGIRTLASRNRFVSLWAGQENFPQVLPSKEADFLFKFKNTVLSEKAIVFNFALYTKEPVLFNITLNTGRGPLRYQPMTIQGPVDTNLYGLNLGFPSGAVVDSMTVVITNKQGDQLAEVNTKL